MAYTTPAPTDLAWAAGFFDGEGCTTGTECQQMSVTQSDLEPLERLQRIFHGWGSIRLKNDHHNPMTTKPCWAWHVSAFEQFQQVLALMWPYLGTAKREQARRTIERVRTDRCRRYVNGKPYKTRRLSAADVVAIRGRAAAGERHNAVARDFGVSRQMVNAIIARRTWKHV